MITEVRPEALCELRDSTAADGPIALVNLLLFADSTEVDGRQTTGEEAYAEYVRRIEPALVREGGRPVFRARGSTVLVGRSDEKWDEVVIVWYPSRTAFERLADSKEYRANAHYRVAALADARLIAVTAPQRIGRLVAALYALTVRMRRR